ncbi:MAG: hypothetical protein FWE74_04700 [Oscillospiraceae bacterium]|nr:hypothetical protein [Oscillospiraceae bacterium]
MYTIFFTYSGAVARDGNPGGGIIRIHAVGGHVGGGRDNVYGLDGISRSFINSLDISLRANNQNPAPIADRITGCHRQGGRNDRIILS